MLLVFTRPNNSRVAIVADKITGISSHYKEGVGEPTSVIQTVDGDRWVVDGRFEDIMEKVSKLFHPVLTIVEGKKS